MASYNPLNYFPPGNVPAAALTQAMDPHLLDFMNHVQHYHAMRGKKVSHDDVLNMVDSASDELGLGRVEGRGLFGHIWAGIKGAVKNTAGKAWDTFKADPIGTVQTMYKHVAPVVKAGVEAAKDAAAAEAAI
jgi:hypothetical protein